MMDSTACDLGNSAWSKAMYSIHTATGKIQQFMLWRSRLGIINTHFVQYIRTRLKEKTINEDMVYTAVSASNPELKFDLAVADIVKAIDITSFGSSDVSVFLWTNTNVNMAPDFTENFFSEAEHAKFVADPTRADLYVITPTGGQKILNTVIVPTNDVQVTVGVDYSLRRAYSYPLSSLVNGDCGALLVIENRATGRRKFLGIHAAGNNTLGFATAINRESLEQAAEHFLPQIRMKPLSNEVGEVLSQLKIGEKLTASPMSCFEPISFPDEPFLGVFPIHVCLARRFQPHLGSNTHIRASLFQLEPSCPFVPTKKPARLSKFMDPDGNIVEPFYLALSKYVPAYIPLANLKWIEECADAEFAFVESSLALFPPKRREVLSFEIAVAGDEADPLFKAIPRQTSPGWPLVLEANPKHPHKTLWLGREGPVNFDNPHLQALKAEVLAQLEKAKLGIREYNVCLDVLKDELVSLEKAASGATRFISATSLLLLIRMRMLYGAFAADMLRTCIVNGSAVGANPYSNQWQDIVMWLQHVGKLHMGDGDFKFFDSSLLASVLWAIHDRIIVPYYGLPYSHPENMARRVTWAEIVNSLHIWKGTVYEWLSSHPSGHFLTAVLNSLYVRIAFRKAWIELHPRREAAIADFDHYVRVIALGDDHVYSVHPKAAHFYKPTAFVREFAFLGLGYTDSTKQPIVEDVWKTIEQVSFLKRSFRYEASLDRYVAPIELRTIRETVLWHPDYDHNHAISRDRFSIAIMELSLHSDAVWEEFSGPMFACYKKAYRLEYPIKSKAILMRKILDTTWETTSARFGDQDLIGLLGSGASKGDGPSDSNSAAPFRPLAGRVFVLPLLSQNVAAAGSILFLYEMCADYTRPERWYVRNHFPFEQHLLALHPEVGPFVPFLAATEDFRAELGSGVVSQLILEYFGAIVILSHPTTWAAYAGSMQEPMEALAPILSNPDNMLAVVLHLVEMFGDPVRIDGTRPPNYPLDAQ